MLKNLTNFITEDKEFAKNREEKGDKKRLLAKDNLKNNSWLI